METLAKNNRDLVPHTFTPQSVQHFLDHERIGTKQDLSGKAIQKCTVMQTIGQHEIAALFRDFINIQLFVVGEINNLKKQAEDAYMPHRLPILLKQRNGHPKSPYGYQSIETVRDFLTQLCIHTPIDIERLVITISGQREQLGYDSRCVYKFSLVLATNGALQLLVLFEDDENTSLYTINLTSEVDEIAYIIARHGYREKYPCIKESFGQYITLGDHNGVL